MRLVGVSRDDQRGQASVETVITAGTILMFLPAIVAMFEYAELRQWVNEVSRYAAWERSVWADRDEGRWNKSDRVSEADRAVHRSDRKIAKQAMIRVGDTRWQVMQEGSEKEASELVREQFELPDTVAWAADQKSSDSPTLLASKPDASRTFARQQQTAPERSTVMSFLANNGADINLGRIKDKFNLKLGDQAMAKIKVQVQVKDLFADGAIDADPLNSTENMGSEPLGGGGGTFTMASTSALHANAWSPQNEDVFRSKVHSLDTKQLVEVGAGLASLGMAPAANYGKAPMDSDSESAFDRLAKFGPVAGQINAMWPEMHQDSADVPFNRAKLYGYGSIPGMAGPSDAYSELDPTFADQR